MSGSGGQSTLAGPLAALNPEVAETAGKMPIRDDVLRQKSQARTSAPERLSSPELGLSTAKERIDRVRAHLHVSDGDSGDIKGADSTDKNNDGGGSGGGDNGDDGDEDDDDDDNHDDIIDPARSQVVYGIRNPDSERIDWYEQPPHEDESDSITNIVDGEAAYVVRKVSDGRNCGWYIDSIIIQSPHIMKILRDVLADYPDISPAVPHLTLTSPFKELLHRWADFGKAIVSAGGPMMQHTAGLVEILEGELAVFIQALRNADEHGTIEHGHLWTIFVPNQLVWWDLKDHHCVGKLLRTEVNSRSGAFHALCEQTIWDGSALKSDKVDIKIPRFDGTRPIAELKAIPFSRKPNMDQIREAVIQRGKKFLSLLGCQHREYLGLAESRFADDFDRSRWHTVSGRIILDAALWHGKAARRKDPPHAASSFGDSELLICSPRVKGYSLSKKQWYDASDIVWDDSFSSLVLGKVEKDLLLGFTQTKLSRAVVFDDMTRGKGKGVIILLTGPPGVGKTLTVESIADEMRAPLFTLSAGRLGTDPVTVEDRLHRVLEYCKEWNAVLLVDEADVFLERRSLSQLQRNELVSIFLRLLEYFDGIMFLTTNRSHTIDLAFQSRIDLTIPYESLPESSRAAVWRNFIKGLESAGEMNVEELASHPFNGRQIKNVVKLARMLATKRSESLHMDHLRQIIQLSLKGQTFEDN